jgi:hypothetical protein
MIIHLTQIVLKRKSIIWHRIYVSVSMVNKLNCFYVHLMRNSRDVDYDERRRLTVRQSNAHTVLIILTAPLLFFCSFLSLVRRNINFFSDNDLDMSGHVDSIIHCLLLSFSKSNISFLSIYSCISSINRMYI